VKKGHTKTFIVDDKSFNDSQSIVKIKQVHFLCTKKRFKLFQEKKKKKLQATQEIF